jgi:U3 small nucleolar RNA-associated protein 21
MCSASSNGDASIWDLDNKRLFHIIQPAHEGNIVNAEFLNGQPILLTVGADNAAKVCFEQLYLIQAMDL